MVGVLVLFEYVCIWCFTFLLIFWQLTCGICFEAYPRAMIHATVCGHPFCDTCWAGLV